MIRAVALGAALACVPSWALAQPAGSNGADDTAGPVAGSNESADGAGSASGGSAKGSADGSGSAAPGDLAGSAEVSLDASVPDVRAAASPTVVRLGTHFTVYITATFSAGVEVNLREPLELGPAFEVRRRLSEDQQSTGGRTTREWQLDVIAWELGERPIAPIAVTFTAFGRAGQVQTNAVPMKVVGTLGEVDDPKAMRGLAAPAGLWARDWFWIWTATAGGAVLGIVIAALWLRRRRRQRTRRLIGGAIARPVRVDMTGELALERLLAVERSGVLDRDRERKLGYAEMVEVIRDYLGARFRIAVHDLTSSELIHRLRALAPGDEADGVAAWLDGCDLVKYGGLRASPAEAARTLHDARALIVLTTQRAAAAKEAA